MKRILIYGIVTALLLGVLPVCALATTAESPIILGGTGDDVCYGTLALPDGSVILSMSSSGGHGSIPEYDYHVYKAWLMCLAPDGSTVWETTFGDDEAGAYTVLRNLILNEDGTFSGTVSYSISQYSQYRQPMTFSCADGSLVSEGEKVMDTVHEDNVFRTYYTHGDRTIISETYDCEATCDPRMLRMVDADGNELWELDANEIGISHIRDWFPTAQGALLYGRNTLVEDTVFDQAVALLIDETGAVLWYYKADIENGFLNIAILDSEGRFIGAGIEKGKARLDADGHLLGYGTLSQLLVCLDAATGAEIWQRVTEMADRMLPYDNLLELDGQYILCDSGANYTCSAFETLDWSGNELEYWTTTVSDYTLIGPYFFEWNGDLWTRTMLDNDDMDILLERVVIP